MREPPRTHGAYDNHISNHGRPRRLRIPEAAAPAPALDPYVSQLFRKASAYAEAISGRWYALSARHGLVHPDTVIEPYAVRLGTNDRTSPPIHACAGGVRAQLAIELAGLENVT